MKILESRHSYGKVENPSSGKRISADKADRIILNIFESNGGEHWETITFDMNCYMFNGKLSVQQCSGMLSDGFREKGYCTQFHTKSGKYTENLTAYFSIINPQKDIIYLDISVLKDDVNSESGKTFFDVEISEVY